MLKDNQKHNESVAPNSAFLPEYCVPRQER